MLDEILQIRKEGIGKVLGCIEWYGRREDVHRHHLDRRKITRKGGWSCLVKWG
jgi:hypothetical protein